jgi:hypothetical protein
MTWHRGDCFAPNGAQYDIPEYRTLTWFQPECYNLPVHELIGKESILFNNNPNADGVSHRAEGLSAL